MHAAMYAFTISLALILTAAAVVMLRQRHCRHRFGHPISGYVCCLRCTRRFPIQHTTAGEWRIGKIPVELDPPGHPPASAE